MANEQGDMQPSGDERGTGDSGIRRTLLGQGLAAWRLKKRLVKQHPRAGMEKGRGSRKLRATKAPPSSWTGPTTGACGRPLNMRSALLAMVVLVITALGCTSQGESLESATAPPNLGNTPRPTHTPQPAAPAILSATAPPSLENTPRPTHTPAPTTPATLPATAPPTPVNTPRPTHTPAPTTPAIFPTFQPGERAVAHQIVRDAMDEGLSNLGEPAATETEYNATCKLLRKHQWDLVESVTDPDATASTSTLAGGLLGVFKELTLIQEERGLPVYSQADFCEDVTGTPHPTTPATLPATAPPAPVNTPHPPPFPSSNPGSGNICTGQSKT